MIDICFVGNSSIDFIKQSGKSKRLFGGSALYSSLSCRCSSNKNIAIISNVNHDIKNLLESKNIKLYGNVYDKITSFKIDEKLNTCDFINKVNNNIRLNNSICIDYLHISFRKGVDVDYILNNKNIKYRHLSIDVMSHSVKEFIPMIKKYIDRINIIFCNNDEYQVIKEYINDVSMIVITNQDRPVLVIQKDRNDCYNVPQNIAPISTTGAGDTFIGGFLAIYSENKKVDEAVAEGIKNASYSITRYGPIDIDNDFNFKNKSYEIPKNIIVIGNSCSGKTTFIDYFKKHFNIYTDIDDLKPLLEMFMIDDVSSKYGLEGLKKIENKLVYMKDIYNAYITDYPNIRHYSRISKNGIGHDIINSDLWDIILEKSMVYLKTSNIIQFSRGRDIQYERKYGKDIYNRSLSIVFNYLTNKESTIIINIVSDLDTRKIRNNIRYQNGGHYISDDTMNNVYKEDIFKYDIINNSMGIINIDGKNYPVYTIENNKMLSMDELKEFFDVNILDLIDYFNEYKEDLKNGYEENTK